MFNSNLRIWFKYLSDLDNKTINSQIITYGKMAKEEEQYMLDKVVWFLKINAWKGRKRYRLISFNPVLISYYHTWNIINKTLRLWGSYFVIWSYRIHYMKVHSCISKNCKTIWNKTLLTHLHIFLLCVERSFKRNGKFNLDTRSKSNCKEYKYFLS